MDRIEEVKKLIYQHLKEVDAQGTVGVFISKDIMVDPCLETADFLAEQICQLFEPKTSMENELGEPAPGALEKLQEAIRKEPKPDESRLLPEQELREKIARELWRKSVSDRGFDARRWEEVLDDTKEYWLSCADIALALVKEAGYVKLDKDQSLPKIPYDLSDEYCSYYGYSGGQQDMLKATWRKVKLEVKDGEDTME